MFTIELSDEERGTLMFALGAVFKMPGAFDLARRIADLKPATSPSAAPAEKPRPIPADAKELNILPLAIEKVGEGQKERLVVNLKTGGQMKKASCWASEKAIWPRLLEKVKQPITVLVVEKSGYLNIVGVK